VTRLAQPTSVRVAQVEAEQAVLRRIEGMEGTTSLRGIATSLNAEGIAAKGGGR
jgi:hypothetical protein